MCRISIYVATLFFIAWGMNIVSLKYSQNLDFPVKYYYTILYEHVHKGDIMPKIIGNLETRLIAEAKKQTTEFGYGTMTIRSVAQSCGVGVGTVYNYFSSKEELVAAFMLVDWKKCVSAIDAVSSTSEVPVPVIRSIFDQLHSFNNLYKSIFQDASASAGFAGAFSKYHKVLRDQLANPLRKFCESDFAAEFIAESLLTWTMRGKSFQEIYGILQKLF